MTDELGYIICTRHHSAYEGTALFWKPDRNGYISDISRAGLYTETEGKKIETETHGEDYWIPTHKLKGKTIKVVDVIHTRKEEIK